LEDESKRLQTQEMTLEAEGPDGLFAVFSEDEGAGYFCVYKPKDDKVLAQIQVYVCSEKLSIREKDVLLMWSSDTTKCGITIWGWMRGIINIKTGKELCAPIENRRSTAITDLEWLKGFDHYLDQDQFMEARGRYWRDVAKQYKPDLRGEKELPPLETNFILYEKGPATQFGVFEDDGDTGYLYLYEAEERKILRHLHIYDHPKKLKVTRDDVDIVWSEDFVKCGVIIWEKMRGIIDFEKSQEGRVKLESRDTPGIGDREWLKGFYLYSKPN